MRLALALVTFVLAGSGVARAQESAEQQVEADAAAPVIVVEEGDPDTFGGTGDFTIGFGRPTTFDSLRLDVRESLRPRPSYGPGPVFCTPSIPDC